MRWDDYVRNDDIGERLCQPSVSTNLRKARLKWFGYAERMGEDKQVKRVMNAEMEGRRPDGRPRTRWKDVLRRDLASSGLSLGEAATDGRLSCWPHAATAPRGVKSKVSQGKEYDLPNINPYIQLIKKWFYFGP